MDGQLAPIVTPKNFRPHNNANPLKRLVLLGDQSFRGLSILSAIQIINSLRKSCYTTSMNKYAGIRGYRPTARKLVPLRLSNTLLLLTVQRSVIWIHLQISNSYTCRVKRRLPTSL